MFEICWKLTIKAPGRRQLCYSGVFIDNFDQISYIVLLFSLLALNKYMSFGWKLMFPS